MKAPPIRARQVAALSRTLDACPDPIALYATLCDGGRRDDTLLLQSADQSNVRGETSLVMSRAALRLRCHNRRVEVTALSANGRSVLPWLAKRLGGEDDDPSQKSTQVSFDEDAGQLRADFVPALQGASERERLAAPCPLDAVRAMVLGLEPVGGEPVLPPLVAGSFAYDLLGAYEALPAPKADPTGWPDFELWLAEELIWIQHAERKCTLLHYVYGGANAEVAYHDAQRAMPALAQRCLESPAEQSDQASRAARIRATPLSREPTVDCDDQRFAALVDKLKEHIVCGDVFQIVPSRSFSLPCPDPLAAYDCLRALNPSPYMFFIRSERGCLFGASPESALTVAGSPARLTISPIAGTRQRGRHADGRIDADLDTRIEAELRLDHKEVAEHMMLVDLARNDVARVSEPGSRYVDSLLDVVRYSHVMHLVSAVSGQLRKGLDALHAYVATMNMGTLMGAPKLKAAELLRGFEPNRRGPYGGAVGYLRSDGQFDSCIVIRSALVIEGAAHVRAGCGVVYDSDPVSEAEETRRKAQAVLVALAASIGAEPPEDSR